MQVICTECGQPYDDEQCCYECVARDEAIEVTFRIVALVAIFGFPFGILIASSSYPLVIENWEILWVPGISLALTVVLLFVMADRLTRYWKWVIGYMILIAI